MKFQKSLFTFRRLLVILTDEKTAPVRLSPSGIRFGGGTGGALVPVERWSIHALYIDKK